MFVGMGRRVLGHATGHCRPLRKARRRLALEVGFSLTLLSVLLGGCGIPRVVHVPVSSEDIGRAKAVVQEADVAFARRDFYSALIKYLEAGRLNPNSENIYNKLGITYSQLDYYTDATQAFERSIGLNPEYAYPYNNLGSVCFASNNKKKAEKHFKKAIGLNNNVASFYLNLGTLYFEKCKFDKGMEMLRKAVDLDPSILGKADGISLVAKGSTTSATQKSYLMARVFASIGNAKRAVEKLDEALNLGFSDLEKIRRERDFDPVREDPAFHAFMRRATILTRP